MVTRRVLHRLTLSVLLVALVLVFRLHLHVVDRLDLVFQDQLQAIFPASPPSPENTVTIVAADEKSLSALGQWPWPRSVHAALVDRLHGAGAKVIAFDGIFPEPDRNGLQNDLDFADALQSANTVLGLSGVPPGQETGLCSFLVGREGPSISEDMLNSIGVLRNIKVLEDAAKGVGLVYTLVYGDGVTRTMPLVWAVDQCVRPSFAIEVVRLSLAQGKIVVFTDKQGIMDVRFNTGLKIPTNVNGEMELRFRPHNPSRFVSAIDVLEAKFDPNDIAGRMVMIGVTAAGLGDQTVTPLGEIVPGVVVHATAVEQILSGQFLHRSYGVAAIEVMLLVALGILFIIALPMLSPLAGLGIYVATGAGLFGGAAYLFTEQGLVFYPVYPVLSLTILFGASLFMQAQPPIKT